MEAEDFLGEKKVMKISNICQSVKMERMKKCMKNVCWEWISFPSLLSPSKFKGKEKNEERKREKERKEKEKWILIVNTSWFDSTNHKSCFSISLQFGAIELELSHSLTLLSFFFFLLKDTLPSWVGEKKERNKWADWWPFHLIWILDFLFNLFHVVFVQNWEIWIDT